jgi:hypothetical protein
MNLSAPLRGFAADRVRVIKRISEEMEIETPAVGAGEEPLNGFSASDLDEILDGEPTTAELRDRLEQGNQRLGNMLEHQQRTK